MYMYDRRGASRFAYHKTRRMMLDAIRRHGLVPATSTYSDSYSEYDDGRHIFFSDDSEYLRGYGGDVLLRFPWPDDAKPDKNQYGRLLAHQFVSRRQVAPAFLEVEEGSEWAPLASV